MKTLNGSFIAKHSFYLIILGALLLAAWFGSALGVFGYEMFGNSSSNYLLLIASSMLIVGLFWFVFCLKSSKQLEKQKTIQVFKKSHITIITGTLLLFFVYMIVIGYFIDIEAFKSLIFFIIPIPILSAIILLVGTQTLRRSHGN